MENCVMSFWKISFRLFLKLFLKKNHLFISKVSIPLVSTLDWPQYTEIVRFHVDIPIIKTKLEKGLYYCVQDVVDDIELLWSNCINYFATNNSEYRRTQESSLYRIIFEAARWNKALYRRDGKIYLGISTYWYINMERVILRKGSLYILWCNRIQKVSISGMSGKVWKEVSSCLDVIRY